MTRRERVLTALRHEQPDVCPWSFDFTKKALAKLIAYTGEPEIAAQVGNHLVSVNAELPEVEVAPDKWRDEWGVVWNRTIDKDIGNPDGAAFPEARLGDFCPPDPDDPARWEGFGAKVAAQGDKWINYSVRYSLFERAWTLRGMERLLMDMVEHPAFVDELLETLTEYQLAILRHALTYPVQGVKFGDDWGSQLGMIMGPKLWRRFLKPHAARLYAAAHAAGKYVFIHSCGKVQEIFPELIEIGLDCFNPFQPEVMDVFEMKRLYGDRLSFNGGVSTQKTLPYGTPAEVAAEAQRLVREVGKNGGLVLAPAHAIPCDAKPENVVALIEAVQNQT
jgi:uroporphyrinogen decarboxylase